MWHRTFISGLAAVGTLSAGSAVIAQDSIKIGLILPMTGQQTTTGRQIEAAVRLYMQQHGATVAGKKIEVVLRDDGAVPDKTKRIAQELLVNDKVSLLAGFGVTPSAFAVAPLATQARIPTIIMAAATSAITERRLGREEWH
jgi:branched-chain amino acid transport system substrate-binding protein